jgi:hypothetical protein
VVAEELALIQMEMEELAGQVVAVAELHRKADILLRLHQELIIQVVVVVAVETATLED